MHQWQSLGLLGSHDTTAVHLDCFCCDVYNAVFDIIGVMWNVVFF